MPHIEIKCYPQEITEQQRQDIAAEVTAILKKHLGSKDESLSVDLIMVEPEQWKSEVWDRQIAPRMVSLIKKPGYKL